MAQESAANDLTHEPGLSMEEVSERYSQWAKDAKYEKDLRIENYKGPKIAADFTLKQFPDESERKRIVILDVAAGSGFVGEELKARGFVNIDALEPSEGMLDLARAKGIYGRTFLSFLNGQPTKVEAIGAMWRLLLCLPTTFYPVYNQAFPKSIFPHAMKPNYPTLSLFVFPANLPVDTTYSSPPLLITGPKNADCLLLTRLLSCLLATQCHSLNDIEDIWVFGAASIYLPIDTMRLSVFMTVEQMVCSPLRLTLEEVTMLRGSDYYDVAVISGGMGEGHIPCSGLHELIRVVKPGGLVIIAMREAYLTSVLEYKDRLEPLMKQLEQEGKWQAVSRTVVPHYSFDNNGVVYIFRVTGGSP